MDPVDPGRLLRPRRTITGMAAVLLPFGDDGAIDWPAFQAHVARIADAGLVPAVNMDTGYVHLLSDGARTDVLRCTRATLGGAAFVAGAYVEDAPEAPFDLARHAAACEEVERFGGTPVVFPSHGLAGLSGQGLVEAFDHLSRTSDRLIGFELSSVFNPAGRVWDLDTYRSLLGVPALIGAKHSSLRRQPEWDRLQVRDEVRPEFLVLTGNDLAIDMVMYGSDYLLGLATFAPEAFARRDQCWAAGDPGFHEINDALQHLGNIAFRHPVPAYRHDAALFLRLRGWIDSDAIPPGVPRRPPWEGELLRDAAHRLGVA